MPPKPFPTHFLCIPLVNAASRTQLAQSLAAFAADVTDSFGIPHGAIRPVGTLHLTLGVCSFPKNEGLDRAGELLKSLRVRGILESARQHVAGKAVSAQIPSAQDAHGKDPAQDGADRVLPSQVLGANEAPLLITLRGLASMQTPSKASVLYAHPLDEEGVLQVFCEKLRGIFVDEGLMQDEGRPLLLHATVVNTIYVKSTSGDVEASTSRTRKGRRGDRLTFDARPVIKRYEDQVWMKDFPVDKIALCRMGAKKLEVDGVVVDEVYEAVAEAEF